MKLNFLNTIKNISFKFFLFLILSYSYSGNAEIIYNKNIYQLENQMTTGLLTDLLFPKNTTMTIYSHCITPDLSSTNEGEHVHADYFLNSKSNNFAPIWILGMHSHTSKNSSSNICIEKTIKNIKLLDILTIYNPGNVHFETGAIFENEKFSNIYRAEFESIFKELSSVNVFLSSNNLLTQFTEFNLKEKNKIFNIEFKKLINIHKIVLPINNSSPVNYIWKINNEEFFINEQKTGLLNYLVKENLNDINNIELYWTSNDPNAEIHVRPLMIWVENKFIY